MNRAKKNKIIGITLILFFFGTIFFLSGISGLFKTCKNTNEQDAAIAKLEASCKGLDGLAFSKAEEFCKEFDISCGDSHTVKIGVNRLSYIVPESSLRESSWDDQYRSHGALLIDFNKTETGRNMPSFSLGFDCASKDIFIFENKWQYQEYVHKYGGLVPRDVKWEFMSEDQALNIMKQIALKLKIPEDMVFNGIAKNSNEGLWNAYWIRKKEGIQYEDDGMVISIMGKTGEFVAYEKRYRMSAPAQMAINITREEAVNKGWTELLNKIPDKGRKQITDIKAVYEVKAETRIIQTDKYDEERGTWLPLRPESTKLAWTIQYEFTGGLKKISVKNEFGERTPEEEKMLREYIGNLQSKHDEYGNPTAQFYVKINAVNGEMIYEGQSSK
ncbi:MAG: hypothetical protein EPN25_14235 [Nitrospirae bacterium]|nr:MAG: hypothetical protein EPN25_14235 [Nitrospirota bacterium]